MADLLPCPFCGGEAAPIRWTSTDGTGDAGWKCYCTGCQVRQLMEDGLSKKQAIAAWNRRSGVPSEALRSQEAELNVKAVASVHVQHFRQDPAMVNTEFQLHADLAPGSYDLYAAPPIPAYEALLRKALKALAIADAQLIFLGGEPDPNDQTADQIHIAVRTSVAEAIIDLRAALNATKEHGK